MKILSVLDAASEEKEDFRRGREKGGARGGGGEL